MSEFKLPNLGDGVAQGDVLKVLVKVGDTLAVDQSVLELETDKATIEVPSDVAGKVTAINVKAGDKVKPGQAVLILESGCIRCIGCVECIECQAQQAPQSKCRTRPRMQAPHAPVAPDAPAHLRGPERQ